MNELGYAVYDILDGGYRLQGRVLDIVDLVFARKDGYLVARSLPSIDADLMVR